MSATLVVGGQYGDEGKGKILSYLAIHDKPDVVARAGVGPNAGHSVGYRGKTYKLRLVPCGFMAPSARFLIGAGVLVNADVFLKEIKECGIEKSAGIDRRATLITQEYIDADAASANSAKIGTTKTGCGPAAAARASRTAQFVESDPRLKPYLCDVPKEVNAAKRLLIEGTQGFMLSNLYGTYPYVTSKDTSAATFCADVGLGPRKVKDVILVIKAYTTRVGSGPFENEIGVEDAQKLGFQEYGTVTGRPRRTSPSLHWEELQFAAQINSANYIALTKLDVKFPACAGIRKYEQLPADAKAFVSEIESKVGIPVGLIGTGPDAEDTIDRRS
ncbi:MAG: adenylosuccinate synthetase [Candidatus Micrarchaeota archaeon]|nr:adenylosuccinate synthetase [Candidatus Micrarchaeota archaeon]